MGDLLPIFILSIAMFVAIHAINHLLSNMLLQIICGGIGGLIIYLGGAYIFHFSELEEVKYMLNRKK